MGYVERKYHSHFRWFAHCNFSTTCEFVPTRVNFTISGRVIGWRAVLVRWYSFLSLRVSPALPKHGRYRASGRAWGGFVLSF